MKYTPKRQLNDDTIILIDLFGIWYEFIRFIYSFTSFPFSKTISRFVVLVLCISRLPLLFVFADDRYGLIIGVFRPFDDDWSSSSDDRWFRWWFFFSTNRTPSERHSIDLLWSICRLVLRNGSRNSSPLDTYTTAFFTSCESFLISSPFSRNNLLAARSNPSRSVAISKNFYNINPLINQSLYFILYELTNLY